MRLTEKERLVLAAAELRAEAPIEVLKKETGLREHTIRYALRRLIQRGIATPIPLINPQLLGLTIVNIFFSVGAEKRSTRDALVKALMDAPEVVWIGEFGGEFQYGIAVVGNQVGTALELLTNLSRKFQRVFFHKSVAIQSSVTLYHHKYLTSRKMNVKPITCRYTTDTVSIDDTDRAVLSALATYGGESHRQIALKVKMPLSSFELRVKKLRERGVLVTQMYAVNWALFGMQSYKLLVYAKGMSLDLAKGLARFCEQHRNVVYFIECIGSWDFEIQVEAEHPQEVTEVIQELYEQFGSLILNISLLNRFSDLKIRWFS